MSNGSSMNSMGKRSSVNGMSNRGMNSMSSMNSSIVNNSAMSRGNLS